MNITNVNIRAVENSKLKAIASVTFDDEFVVHDIKVLSGNNNDFYIAMPSRRLADGTFKDIAHPINSDFRQYIQGCILDAFNKM